MSDDRTPRHLHDLTAEMPAIPRNPRHAAPGTGEQSALRLPTAAIPRITADRRQYPPIPHDWRPQPVHVPWWQRAWQWLMGA